MEPIQLQEVLASSLHELKQGNALSGIKIAQVLELLAACELEVGGPYTLPGEKLPDYELNNRVSEFLAYFGVSLPKLDSYISFYRESDTSFLVISRIREIANERFKNFPPEMAQLAIQVVEQTIAKDKDWQITCVAHVLKEALGEKGKELPDEFVARIGYINTLFWAATTIYDDFWDEDEKADPRLLPIANLFSREFYEFFLQLYPNRQDFKEFLRSFMDAMDRSNVWETMQCRAKVSCGVLELPEELPEYHRYKNKFYPVAGHVFGPVALFLKLGHQVNSVEVKSLISFYKHCIIARQLNDDLHDWREDLAAGHISSVVKELLQEWKKVYPHRKSIFISNHIKEIEEMFWQRVLVPMCNQILSHCASARESLEKMASFENTTDMEKYIAQSEQPAQKALQQFAQTQEFLSALQQK